jgi:DNA-binding response OmpR family regulator
MRPLAIIGRHAASSSEMIAAFDAAGFSTTAYADATMALPALRMRTFSLALVGLDLQDTDPFAFCHELSRIVPVITFTPGHDTALCVRALESGADDCITTPISGRELVARVHSVLRRTGWQGDEMDELSVAVREMRIRVDGTTHELSLGESEVLALLLENAPSPLTTVEIARRLKSRRGTIESRIKTLRKKIGARVVTRGRFGYSVECGR